ncbi:hypothetical protein F2P81_017899 [Scophthalmus maximus]|uniref:Uncharacterized protein n=1 Tax=Scophthalmus maximus TaxID=52904 RepID=A0A6A4SD50_SCOMX|nr:hypothetical protein F2P81_017899 [Scophthalmus maximus]
MQNWSRGGVVPEPKQLRKVSKTKKHFPGPTRELLLHNAEVMRVEGFSYILYIQYFSCVAANHSHDCRHLVLNVRYRCCSSKTLFHLFPSCSRTYTRRKNSQRSHFTASVPPVTQSV